MIIEIPEWLLWLIGLAVGIPALIWAGAAAWLGIKISNAIGRRK